MLNLPSADTMLAEKLRESRKYFHRNYLWLFGIVSSIIFYQKLPAFYPALILLLAIAGSLAYWRCFREILILFLALLLGYLAAAVNEFSEPTLLLKGRWTQQNVVIADSGAVGETSEADDLLPDRVRANGRINGKSVSVQLYFPEKMPNPGVSEGEKWQVSGNFYQLEGAREFLLADENGTFQDVSSNIAITSYQNYLRLNKISGVLVVDAIKKLPDSSQSTMTRWRRGLLQRLDRGIENSENRALLGAVVLGIRSRLPGALKRQFSAVGAGHLFSVSGLHVGVMAMLILLILRPLPPVWHYLLLSMLAGYVLLTGGNAPAVRAFAMVWMLEFFRGKLLHVRTLELLSLIAAVLLLYDADFLCDGGFQYSFVITAILIAAAPMARDVVRSAGGATVWWGDVPRWKLFLYKLRGKFCGAIFFACIAALASAALMLFHQNMFFAGSMLVNLLILPALAPLFAFAIIKVLFPWGSGVWNFFLDFLLNYIKLTVNIAGEAIQRSSWMTPEWYVAGLFIAAMILFLLLNRKKWVLMPLAGMFILLAVQLNQSTYENEKIAAVISGGSLEHPVMAILLPHANTMYVANAGRDAVNSLNQLAYSYGINRIERLDITHPVADCVDGLGYLQKNFLIGKLRIVKHKKRSQAFEQYIGKQPYIIGGKKDSLSISGAENAVDLEVLPHESGAWCVKFGQRDFLLKRTAFPRTIIIKPNCGR